MLRLPYKIISAAVAFLLVSMFVVWLRGNVVPLQASITLAALLLAALVLIWDQTKGFTEFPVLLRGPTERLKSFREYKLSASTMLSLIILIYFFISLVVSLASGVFWWYLGSGYSKLYIPFLELSIPPPDAVLLESLCLFFLGCWVGARAERLPYLISGLGIGGLSLLYLLTSLAGDMPAKLTDLVGHTITTQKFLLSNLFFVGVSVCVILAGVSRGRENQYSAYIRYAFRSRDRSLQQEIADSIHERLSKSSP